MAVSKSNFAFHWCDIYAFFFGGGGWGGTQNCPLNNSSTVCCMQTQYSLAKGRTQHEYFGKNPDLDFHQELILALDTSCSWDLAPIVVHAQWATFDISTWLRGFQAKMVNFIHFFCLVNSKRDVETKKTPPNIEVCKSRNHPPNMAYWQITECCSWE